MIINQYMGTNPYNQMTNSGYNTSGGRALIIGGFGSAPQQATPTPTKQVQQAPQPEQPPYQPPQQQPQPSGGGGSYGGGYGGGGGNYPMMMLEQQVQQQAPMPVGGQPTSPKAAAQTPDPTIFDVGRRVSANPNLAQRNPAYEGLLKRFRSQAY